jgi:hypothetical protein
MYWRQYKVGDAKGLKIVLQERRLWKSNLTKSKCAAVLVEQEDFRNQKTELEEFVRGKNATILRLPICHTELNPTEQVWGYTKRIVREAHTAKLGQLRAKIQELFFLQKGVIDAQIQKFDQRSWDWSRHCITCRRRAIQCH